MWNKCRTTYGYIKRGLQMCVCVWECIDEFESMLIKTMSL